MNLNLILKLIAHAAQIAESAKVGLDALKALASKSGASPADVAHAVEAGRAAASKLDDVADAILARLDAKGK